MEAKMTDPGPARPGRASAAARTSRRRVGRLAAAVCSSAAIGLAALAAAAIPAAPAHAQDRAQAPLPRVELQAGVHLIRAEVAADNTTRARGLMFRERLGANEGMLFVFEEKTRQCFWMRNTLIPLSIAFIDDDGSIVNVEDMAPKTEDSHCSAKPIRYALEMEQGWFAKRGFRGGARLRGPKGLFSGG